MYFPVNNNYYYEEKICELNHIIIKITNLICKPFLPTLVYYNDKDYTECITCSKSTRRILNLNCKIENKF